MFIARVAAASVLSFSTLFISPSADAGEFRQIKTEAEFRKLVVGKKITLGDNHFTVRRNGSLKGNFGGNALKGAWQWRGEYWCRTLTTHTKNTDCQLWEVSGKQIRATRDKGKGKSFTYTYK